MISIITSVHNQLEMNKLFYETLKKKSRLPFELIVVDNQSTDGSREYFQQFAQHLISNQGNYSYPHCQNQGTAVAQYDHLAFFNNDILVSEGWDEKILAIMKSKGIEAISFATNDHLENKSVQRKLHKRWKRRKFLMQTLMGTGRRSLLNMVRLTYGDLDRYCDARYRKFGDQVIEGFSGSCILLKRSVLEKIGSWDERMQAADFDLYFRIKEREAKYHDIQPLQLALGVYIHHFQRLTLRAHDVPAFTDQQNIITLKEKWGDRIEELYQDVIG